MTTTTASVRERQENLWLKAMRGFWADPQNVIGPPGALVRRMFKVTWMFLSIYILIWVAAPLQIASWQLWMTDDVLAARVGWSFTIASALCFAIVRYAAQQTEPIKMPIFLPTLRGWRDWRTAHLHLPIPTVMAGSVLVVALFGISLLGLWNLYLHDQQTTGGASVAALSGSTDRVAEAERALHDFETRTSASMAAATLAIQQTSAGSPTGRSRLVRQQAEAARISAGERQQLQAELRAARAETVTTHQTFSDPRPVDAQMAGVTGWGRPVTASVLDLLRSAVIETLLVMGAALGLVGATSRIGAPAGGEAGVLPKQEEVVEETTSAPEAPEPLSVKRRYTLPTAIAEDYARAAVVGPGPSPVEGLQASDADEPAAAVETDSTAAVDDAVSEEAPPSSEGVDDPELASEPVVEATVDEPPAAEIDPLAAEALASEAQEERV